ncbi:helix-turn-helix domain-containing protein [Sediminibacterium sp.]|uniref:helix-turn-helix domain-containing protein n=1 Tax=Sediminibacterium sp. TaxID=1917865 RepID=UPI0027337648|nr:helix-turn-helix domain-containing protein [Sediminibacterium sp.]MDP3392543.1 helix-turn-helix domain-containing protein [Sediminibacterium sp.]MDP3565809.1 helix-turn-helix domain-containing protein [Sediminibacterium sp.]
MLISEIGNRIKLRRKALRITQSDLSQLANISINTLYKIERGQTNPTIDIIEKIIAVLGLEMKLSVKESSINPLS